MVVAAVDDVVASVVVVGPTTANRQLSNKINAEVEHVQIVRHFSKFSVEQYQTKTLCFTKHG